MNYFFSFLLFICSAQSFAQNLVISDVDDTIKLADVPSYTGSFGYAIDEYSHFTGMESVYHLIQKDMSAHFYYLSKAPEWLLKTVHQDFLIRAGFPAGTYIGRTNYSAQEHKLRKLREILTQVQPQRVLLIGDNGEQDAAVYAQIVSEFSSKGIEFTQYIHIVYTAEDLWGSMIPLSAEQTGFVTSVELAVDLETKNWLGANSVQDILQSILPRILNERPGATEGDVAFPAFMNCQNIEWKWNIPGLNEKIQRVCAK